MIDYLPKSEGLVPGRMAGVPREYGHLLQRARCPQCNVVLYSSEKHAETCTWEADQARAMQNLWCSECGQHHSGLSPHIGR